MSVQPAFVTGIVLAAGASSRLGQPKRLLSFRGATLLDATLGLARDAGFDQLLVPLGGSAHSVRANVDLAGVEVVENPEFGTGCGCGSSLQAAMGLVDSRADGVVLLLGDQPGVRAETVQELIAASD